MPPLSQEATHSDTSMRFSPTIIYVALSPRKKRLNVECYFIFFLAKASPYDASYSYPVMDIQEWVTCGTLSSNINFVLNDVPMLNTYVKDESYYIFLEKANTYIYLHT